MNPDLQQLQPYPFERLRALFADLKPPTGLPPIDLSIGEPKHPTPPLVRAALVQALDGLSVYPATVGSTALREAIAAWIGRRFGAPVDPATQVLPVNGTREALFALAQAVVDRTRPARVVLPNPFYQIYEGAALLAGARPLYLSTVPEDGFRMPFERLTASEWAQVQLVYVCSPGNPTGRVLRLDEWQLLFELSARHGFIVAADECYSEIYFDEKQPPLGSLQAARLLGLHDYARLVSFGSLSKRSNVPGLRSGYVAGDARILRQFLLYRTYHGNAMSPPVQAASIAAWNDEAHVRENRRLYAEKFAYATPYVAQRLPTEQPQAGFYLWARTPGDDTEYARDLYARRHVTVLPGSFLAREVDGLNPGRGFVRIALVAGFSDVMEAAQRIASLD